MLPRYDSACPGKLSDEEYKTRIRPKVDTLLGVTRENEIRLHDQSTIRLEYDIFHAFFVMCTSDILMIDFDIKLDFTREDSVQMVTEYTDYMHELGHDMMFQLYDTDRGVHAFLCSHRKSFLSEDALRIMIDMCNDELYIGMSEVRGFCIRVSPKVKMLTADTVGGEFVARPLKDNFRIGYGEVDPYISTVLDVHLELIRWLTEQYTSRFDELKQLRYTPELDKVVVMIPREFLDEAREEFVHLLDERGILETGVDFFRPQRYYGKLVREDYTIDLLNDRVRLSYDMANGIWALCTNDILMVDFDDLPKEEIILLIREFVEREKKEGREFRFSVYETDRGIHAFLTSRYVDHRDPWTRYTINALTPSNTQHLDFVTKSGHCVRVGPKLINSDGSLKSKEDILDEFVTKKCFAGVCSIGYGTELSSIINILDLHEEVADRIKSEFRTNFDGIARITRVPKLGNKELYMPSREVMQKLRDFTLFHLGSAPLSRDITSNTTKSRGVRYEGLIPDSTVSACSSRNIAELVSYSDYSIKQSLVSRGCKDTILMRGPTYPFVVGFDPVKSFYYMMFYDLLSIDWDIVDGIPKKSTIAILERFLERQRVEKGRKRLTLSDMCFKLYETDAGVHAYCVSHRLPFYTQSSSKIMLELCGDYHYAAFSRAAGYSLRLNPKVYDKKGNVLDVHVINNQFVQREGVNGVVYVGNENNVDPYLDSLTEILYNTQKYITDISDIGDILSNKPEVLGEWIRDFVREEYSGAVADMPISKDNVAWARGILSCPYTVPR